MWRGVCSAEYSHGEKLLLERVSLVGQHGASAFCFNVLLLPPCLDKAGIQFRANHIPYGQSTIRVVPTMFYVSLDMYGH